MGEAKIRLSQTELELVTSADWILTKNAILQKVKILLAGLQEKQQPLLVLFSPGLPPEVLKSTPKISKGENYNGLPYLLLDYPRIFTQQNIFAIRTMFWWGHFFSITVHLSGVYKKMMEQKIIDSYDLIKENGFYTCVNDNQWEHHFEKDNYTRLDELPAVDFEQRVKQEPFIKLANKISLEQWDESGEILLRYFKQLIQLLADQPPRR
ncbi:MAG: hypothetical protein H7Y01_01150 [Ferruginibacter sp.]|nr:hypothetical protein [Chitinophagaceae bacterium]